MCHRQVDIGDPLLARYIGEVEGEDEVDVVGGPAHHEDSHHHTKHLHLVSARIRAFSFFKLLLHAFPLVPIQN